MNFGNGLTPAFDQKSHAADGQHRAGQGTVRHMVLFFSGGVYRTYIQNFFACFEAETSPDHDPHSHNDQNDRCCFHSVIPLFASSVSAVSARLEKDGQDSAPPPHSWTAGGDDCFAGADPAYKT